MTALAVTVLGVPVSQGSDPEEFCPDCFAGMESSEHHEKCVSPLDAD